MTKSRRPNKPIDPTAAPGGSPSWSYMEAELNTRTSGRGRLRVIGNPLAGPLEPAPGGPTARLDPGGRHPAPDG